MALERPIVLVVEDNKDIRDVLALFLLEKGCHILEASDGRQGVRLAREAHPDLVLMDLNLPYLSGLQATTILKNHSDTKSIPVVALSAHCRETGWREKALGAGCENCLVKPIDFAELERVLRPYLGSDADSALDSNRGRQDRKSA